MLSCMAFVLTTFAGGLQQSGLFTSFVVLSFRATFILWESQGCCFCAKKVEIIRLRCYKATKACLQFTSMPCFLKMPFLRGMSSLPYTKILWSSRNFDAAFVDCVAMNRKLKPHSANYLLCDVFIFLMVFSSKVLLQYCFS